MLYIPIVFCLYFCIRIIYMASASKNNTIIFTIGRMNPPTTGHLGMIYQMLLEANKQGLNDIFIILSHSQDNKKNPLLCDKKRKFLNTMKQANFEEIFPNIKIHLLCMDDAEFLSDSGKPSTFAPVRYLAETHRPENMLMFIGEDRGGSYQFMKKILGDPEKTNPLVKLDFHILERPEGAMSATYIRNLVKYGNRDRFIFEQLKTGISVEEANELFDIIARALSKASPSKSKTRATSIKRKRKSPTARAKKTKRKSPTARATKGGRKTRKTTKKRKRCSKN